MVKLNTLAQSLALLYLLDKIPKHRTGKHRHADQLCSFGPRKKQAAESWQQARTHPNSALLKGRNDGTESKDGFYLPDTSRKLQLQGISKRSNTKGTSAAACLSTQTSGDGHGGFISWRRERRKKGWGIFLGGVLSDGEKGSFLLRKPTC